MIYIIFILFGILSAAGIILMFLSREVSPTPPKLPPQPKPLDSEREKLKNELNRYLPLLTEKTNAGLVKWEYVAPLTPGGFWYGYELTDPIKVTLRDPIKITLRFEGYNGELTLTGDLGQWVESSYGRLSAINDLWSAIVRPAYLESERERERQEKLDAEAARKQAAIKFLET